MKTYLSGDMIKNTEIQWLSGEKWSSTQKLVKKLHLKNISGVQQQSAENFVAHSVELETFTETIVYN